MDVDLSAGRYVVAVSGGVDSVVLLHMLRQLPGVELTVAHYDHGIRADSAEDRRHVQAMAREYGLPFVYHTGNLGAEASEAVARTARYQFLHDTRRASGAGAIVTAHHQDDVLETIMLNLIRGTDRRGLSSLRSTDVVRRPLLHISKAELLRYAAEQGLHWREDSTNADTKYLRNYVRKFIMPRLAETDRQRLLDISRRTHELNQEIAQQAAHYLHLQSQARQLDRHSFIMLPHAVAREIMAEWLRAHADVEISRSTLERLVVAAKTGRGGTAVNVNAGYWLDISPARLALRAAER